MEVPQARSAEGAGTKVVTLEPQAKCHDLDRFEEIEPSEPKNNITKLSHNAYTKTLIHLPQKSTEPNGSVDLFFSVRHYPPHTPP